MVWQICDQCSQLWCWPTWWLRWQPYIGSKGLCIVGRGNSCMTSLSTRRRCWGVWLFEVVAYRHCQHSHQPQWWPSTAWRWGINPRTSWRSYRPWQKCTIGPRRSGHWGCSDCCTMVPRWPDSIGKINFKMYSTTEYMPQNLFCSLLINESNIFWIRWII